MYIYIFVKATYSLANIKYFKNCKFKNHRISIFSLLYINISVLKNKMRV